MELLGGTYSNAPLALLTVAALTPVDWDFEIVDENIRDVDLDAPCDVVGITAMNVEGAIHLGMWWNFARYVPELRARLREGEAYEQQRADT